MARYSIRGQDGRFLCIPEWPRRRASACGCALGGSRPCPLLHKIGGVLHRRTKFGPEDRRDFEDHYQELDSAATGLAAEIAGLTAQLKREQTFAGGGLAASKRRSARAVFATRAHRYTPTGRVMHAHGADDIEEEEREEQELRRRRAQARHELAEVKRERAKINTILRRGSVDRPVTIGAYRRRARRSTRG